MLGDSIANERMVRRGYVISLVEITKAKRYRKVMAFYEVCIG